MRARLLPAFVAVVLGGCAAAAVPSVPLVRTPSPEPSPTVAMTASPTVSASPTPVPTPMPTPDPGVLALEVIGCDGGAVLRWSPSTHPDFHHYIALRSVEEDIKPDYPPIAPAVDWGDTYSTDPFVTSAVDASIIPTDTLWHYRVMAYDVDGRVVSASSVQSARMDQVDDLGPLSITTGDDGRIGLMWKAYGGAPQCFSSYRVLHGTDGSPSTLLTSISAQATTELETDALHSGSTYVVRVQAVRATTLGTFVVGETETLFFPVP